MFNLGSTSTINIVVTAGVAVLVILMPVIDSIVCKKVGLNLYRGLSTNPNALRLRRLRQGLLIGVISIYIIACAWLVFFSRRASENYAINSVIMNSLYSTIHYDTGISGAIWNFIRALFNRQVSDAGRIAFQDISQLYLNIMMFVPLGYLLPYVFHYFRDGHRYRRTVVVGFVCSLMIENLQLISKRGLYDVDDLIANTLGTLIGCFFFGKLAYVLTHPDWRKQLMLRRKWSKLAADSAMLPLAKHMKVSRTTLFASNRDAVIEFYVRKLGFRPIAQQKDDEGNVKSMLLRLGIARIELVFDEKAVPEQQCITLYAGDIEVVIDRLLRSGIQIERLYEDKYERLGCVEVAGPDRTKIVWIA